MKKLYPITRSITGEGVRQSLVLIQKRIPLKICEVPSGNKVFDWTIPLEWNIRDAYVKDKTGRKVIDFKKSNLHVVSYSAPVRKKMGLLELKKHLHTLPEYPDHVPYITSYYKEDWGFCLKHRDFQKLRAGRYEVVIDSTLKAGSLTYGEYYLAGKTKDVVLLSTYVCHPSLANDNLSGVALTAELASLLKKKSLRYSYRFLFVPETIGSLAWLSRNEKNLDKIKHGLVVTCVGDRGPMTYKKSRRGDAVVDRAAEKMLTVAGELFQSQEFFPTGSDERQFCSPAFNLPVGSLMRTRYGQYSEYHTSADNLNFIKPATLAASLAKYLSLIEILENNYTYESANPKGEPMLGKRGLYNQTGDPRGRSGLELARLWVLNQSDGTNSLLDISVRSKMKFTDILKAATELESVKLIKKY